MPALVLKLSPIDADETDMPLRQKTVHPFAREGLIQRVLPFAGTALLAFALVPLPPAESQPRSLLLAVFLIAGILTAAFLAPWDRLPPFAQTLPPLAYLPVVALLRDAEGGGASGYAPLVLLPVIWLALYGKRSELAVAIGLAAVCLTLPILFVGAPLYPASEWRRMFLLVAVAGIVGVTVQRLVRRHEELSEQLARLALADGLTGLPNRRAWDDRLPREILRAERDGNPLSVALLDLDHFKRFNDELGHQAGDSLLQACANAWLDQLRATDVLTRYGGEEFALLLPGCTLETAVETAERLRQATPAGQTCSVGVAEWVQHENGTALISRADIALYEAKAAGRDRAVPSRSPELMTA